MGPTLLVARGSSVFVLPSSGDPQEFRAGESAPTVVPVATGPAGPRFSRALVETLQRLDRAAPILPCGEPLARAVERELGRSVRRATLEECHAALRALPPAEPASERSGFLARAEEDLRAALRSPGEVLVSLAREEERLEHAIGREDRAAEAFVAVPGTPLADYAAAWERARRELADHHGALLQRLDEAARRTVPNLSAVVGSRTAARLVAAAGGTAPLARMSASRLQLLGSRRRPDPARGPRYGAIFLADGGSDLPADRRGAYARSLAALAAIAVRADVLTRRSVADALLRRREARRTRLRKGRR